MSQYFDLRILERHLATSSGVEVHPDIRNHDWLRQPKSESLVTEHRAGPPHPAAKLQNALSKRIRPLHEPLRGYSYSFVNRLSQLHFLKKAMLTQGL